jgi:amphi-Trp domain-containing protein
MATKRGKRKPTERDQTRVASQGQFLRTLERLYQSLSAGKSFRIRVKGETITVPANAELSIEHEREGSEEELEVQLRWKR